MATTTVSIAVTRPPNVTVAVTSTGPRGPAGDSSSLITLEAGASLGGHRCVAWQADGTVYHADNLTAADAHAAVGITTGAASPGSDATVRTSGLMTEPSWAWTPLGLIFVGTNGLLTQTAPAAPAFVRVLGHAIDATSMWVDPQPPIIQT